jgi:shikimate kinase
MKVFLVGYMASGKTTIGKVLAKKMNVQFIDLDQYIESRETRSITDVFKSKGEIYFRKKETLYLKELIESDKKAIISLGGGTPCYANNMDLLLNSENAITIYLKASLNELVNRLSKDPQNRPLIAHLTSKESLMEFIGKHLFERSNYYSQSSKTVNVDNKSTDEIVEEIILNLF